MSLFKRKEIFFRTDEHREFYFREHRLINRRNIRILPVLFVILALFFLLRILLTGGEDALYFKSGLITSLVMAGLNLLLVPVFIRPVKSGEQPGLSRYLTPYLTLQSLFISVLSFNALANGRSLVALPVYLVFLVAVLWLETGVFAFLSGLMLLLFCSSVLFLGNLVHWPLSLISSVLIAYLCIWFVYLHIRSLRMENLQNRISLEDQYKSADIESAADPLTGLFNRRYLKADMEKELARSSRSESPFCVAMLDLDHFRAVNDNLGHLAGDEVLKEAADLLRNSLRLSDRIYRFGGECFLFLLPDTVEKEAIILGQRIREKFEAYPFKKVSGPLTVSIGITRSNKDSSFDLLIKKAEAHLNTAKEAGRNRVVCDSCPQ
jgi:diguanylate cyclase (GGDEF)-like protein